MQVSAGHLAEAELSHEGGSRTDVDRITASGTYTRSVGNNVWATTAAWGRNVESEGATDAVLLESSVMLRDEDAWFGRLEIGEKRAHDLDVAAEQVLTVAKLQGGYTRYLGSWRGWKPGVGGEISLGVVPERLAAVYGRRANVGFGLFITLRPAAMAMSH